MDPSGRSNAVTGVATGVGKALVLLILFAGTGLLTLILMWWVAVEGGTVPGTLSPAIALPLIFLPFVSLVVGLATTPGRRGGRRPSLAVATVATLTGSLLTVSVLAVGLPSDAERNAYKEASQARADADLHAAVLARPDITVVEDRFGHLRTRLDAELSGAVPGLRWPSATGNDTSECDAGGNRSGVQIISVGTIAIADADWATTDAAVRRAAQPFGFTGPPIAIQGDGVGFHLDGPHGSRIWVYRDRAGEPVRAGLESGCHRPAHA